MNVPTMSQEDKEQEQIILDTIDRFLERDVKPYVMELDHNDIYPEEIVEKMKALGLFGAIIPEEFGGLGLRPSTYSKIIENISRVWMSLSGIINSHLIMAFIVNKKGTQAQKEYFLPRFATGELRGAGIDRA